MEEPYVEAVKESDEKAVFQIRVERWIAFIPVVGVTLCLALVLAGLAWNLIATGSLRLAYVIEGINVFQFAHNEVSLALSGALDPKVLVNTGIVVLLLTPYARVLASMFYYWFVERNWKYSIISAIVVTILTYSMFLR